MKVFVKKHSIKIRHLKAKALSSSQLDAIQALVSEIDPELPANHIRHNHMGNPETDFYLAYQEDKLVAVSSAIGGYVHNPFTGKRLKLIVNKISYRKAVPGLKEFTQKSGRLFLRMHLGRFWYFKEFLSVCETVNPRMHTQFNKFFAQVYPDANLQLSDEVREFIIESYAEVDGKKIAPDNHLVLPSDPFYKAKTDITDKYQAYYKSKNPEANQLFEQAGILIKENSRVFLTNKAIILVGYFNLLGILRNKKWLK